MFIIVGCFEDFLFVVGRRLMIDCGDVNCVWVVWMNVYLFDVM